MGVQARVAQFRAERALKPMKVGRWTHVRGRPMIEASDAIAGDAFRIWSYAAPTLIRGDGRLRIGDNVFLNNGVSLECWHQITIGDHVLIGLHVVITDSDIHGIGAAPARAEPIHIGSGSWIGARAIILPGVTIGARTTVGAGSVVTRDTPATASWQATLPA